MGIAYETYAHRVVAERVGFPPDIVAALATGEQCDGLGKAEQAAQHFALELARNRFVSDAIHPQTPWSCRTAEPKPSPDRPAIRAPAGLRNSRPAG